jgi:hypothetical protein
MIIYIDIDNTICTTLDTSDYSKSTPITKNIEKVKRFIEEGHEVSFWTARGSVSGVDWSDLTRKQLDSWGLKGIPIIFGKPYFDLFIDDRVMNVEDWV